MQFRIKHNKTRNNVFLIKKDMLFDVTLLISTSCMSFSFMYLIFFTHVSSSSSQFPQSHLLVFQENQQPPDNPYCNCALCHICFDLILCGKVLC